MDLIFLAMTMLNIPYDFGGNNPLIALDCSGFVCEALRSHGDIGKEDYSAQMLYDKFKLQISYEPKRNDLLFFGGNLKSITHVAIAIDNKLMIESGGEGRTPTDNGRVRIRPINSRKDLIITTRLQCLK